MIAKIIFVPLNTPTFYLFMYSLSEQTDEDGFQVVETKNKKKGTVALTVYLYFEAQYLCSVKPSI